MKHNHHYMSKLATKINSHHLYRSNQLDSLNSLKNEDHNKSHEEAQNQNRKPPFILQKTSVCLNVQSFDSNTKITLNKDSPNLYNLRSDTKFNTLENPPLAFDLKSFSELSNKRLRKKPKKAPLDLDYAFLYSENNKILKAKRIFCVKREFKNLKVFLERIFSYEKVHAENLQVMTPNEKSVLFYILKKKKYQIFKSAKETTNFNFFKKIDWNKFFKVRRKEEYIKYSLKLIIKAMQFEYFSLHKQLYSRFNIEKMKLLFYLSYFYETKTGKNFNTLMLKVANNEVILNSTYWKLMESYILPEMGTQSSFSNIKSISKEALYVFSRSKRFSKRLVDYIIDINTFMSYSIYHDWSTCESLGDFNEIEKKGIIILRGIIKTNKIEINKLFSEWNNKIVDFKVKNKHQENENSVSIIKRTINRKNFKFPWAYLEVQRSFIELLFSYLEVFKKEYFIKSSECKIKLQSLI